MVDSSEIQLEQSAGCTATDILKEYPLEQFPNWNITITDRYYVSAPIDKLGDWAFHLRTHLTSLILSGNPAISFLQSFHSPITTRIAYIFTFLGHEEFFFSLVVSMIWLFDARLGRLLAVLLSLGFSICGSLKVAFCLPRPPIPPALKLSDENKDCLITAKEGAA
uniref:GPI mannosyltransferase 2 n=1 Tax=Heterorhabditis bacteriophora TaxID=37862 RepID=A0A1I7XCJ0_HETBA